MSYNLLLVDDDADFREEFCGCFEDYDVIQAPDGETAIGILKKPNVIDLVLLDVTMPGIPGTEVLTEIKKINPDVKVVMLTANRSRDVVIDSLKNRADEYIEKPMNVESTREIIKRLVGEKETKGEPDTGNIRSKIEKVKKFLERNFNKKVSLEDASAHAGLSAKYLSRAFEEVEGIGFSAFKSAVKVKKAMLLLKQGFNINQISDTLAYANAETFIRVFKKSAGCTPALYRNNQIDMKAKAKKAAKGKKQKK